MVRVLVLESERHAADDAVARLEAAGHEVLRCHEPAWQAFPCVGMHGDCPVEEGVDGAVVVRNRGYGLPSPFEDGARCAARHGVPIVVIGDAASNPFEAWTAAHADLDTVADAVADAAVLPIPHLSAAATAALLGFLGLHGVSLDEAAADVRRTGDGLVVDLRLGPLTDRSLVEPAALRVLAAVRELDATSPRVDVALGTTA
jgi:hypothetical protein